MTQARKNLENWPLWIVANGVAVVSYWRADLAYTAFLFGVYLVLAVVGWREWSRAMMLASVVVSGLLPFWQDFFALWTHGTVPYDSSLAITLLIGTSAVAPSILALGYANYSNRGDLLVRTKGLQLVVFLVLSAFLIQPLGPLGAAIAVVASDLLVQFGLLGVIMIGQTLARPFRHVAFLATVMILVTSGGWALGTIIRSWMPGTGLTRFVGECALWLVVVGLAASPLTKGRFRNKMLEAIPR